MKSLIASLSPEQARFLACLAVALIAHAGLFAWSWSSAENDTAPLLRVTRDAGTALPQARNLTRSVQNQQGDDSYSQRARAGGQLRPVGGRQQTSAQSSLTRFVVVATRPSPTRSNAEDAPSAADAAARKAQEEKVRSAMRDARSAYLAAWQVDIEARGSRRYPTELLDDGEARRLTMAVRLGADGELRDVRVLRSSGSAALDDAALEIVRGAAPFAAFNDELARHISELSFAYDWLFEAGETTRVNAAG